MEEKVNIELDSPRIESRRAASQFMDAGGPRLILNVLSAPAASEILLVKLLACTLPLCRKPIF